MAEKQYELIKLAPGTKLERAVEILMKYRSQNHPVCVEFNDVMLYSDTVTMDNAFTRITGMNKAEFDAYERMYLYGNSNRK